MRRRTLAGPSARCRRGCAVLVHAERLGFQSTRLPGARYQHVAFATPDRLRANSTGV
jgi:hypothetical protein